MSGRGGAHLYVYALVPARCDGALGEGIDDEPLRVVPLGDVAAVVGEIDHRPSITPVTLQAHDDVVRRIGHASDAILPFRFGAMVLDARELEEGLRPRIGALAEALERTRGCDQMTLRVFSGERSEVSPQASRRPEGHTNEADAPGPGARWLRERSVTGTGVVDRVRAALVPAVRAERIEPGGAPPLRASLFHLVERDRVRAYERAVHSLAPEIAPARVAASGPWPPYAFTEIE